MSPSRASARTISENMRTPILSLGATSSSIACMIEGTPAMTITLPIQKPGAPATLLRMRSAPLGMRVMLSALRRHHTPRQANTVAMATMEFIRIIELAEASVASLTVGQLKKLELARALAAEPVLLLLDEVMAGLTPPEIKEMMTVIGSLPKRGITVVWVEHVMMAIMNVAERIVVMHQGQIIAQGTPADVSRNPAVIGAYLGEKYAYAAR